MVGHYKGLNPEDSRIPDDFQQQAVAGYQPPQVVPPTDNDVEATEAAERRLRRAHEPPAPRPPDQYHIGTVFGPTDRPSF